MKTIYSLHDFYGQVLELAKSKGIDYVSIKVQMTSHEGPKFSCYANGTDFYEAGSPDDAIELLRKRLYPPDPTKNVVDMEFDIPGQEEQKIKTEVNGNETL